MDAKIALDKIKETEQEAQVIVERAKKEAADILHQTKRERERLIHEARERAAGDARGLKEDAAARTAWEVSALEKQGEEQIRSLKETAAGRMDKAMQVLKNSLSAGITVVNVNIKNQIAK